jgi:hypothetical protein
MRISCCFSPSSSNTFCPLNEIGYTLPGYFAKNGRRRVLGIGQLLPHRLHDAGILPHGEIQEDPLRSKETLYALLGPSWKEELQRTIPEDEFGRTLILPLPAFDASIYLFYAALQHQTTYTKFGVMMSISICFLCIAV